MRHLPTAASLAAALSALAPAQNIVWGQYVPATNAGPRTQHAMATDSVRHRVVMYGGGSPDTWEWDGVTWNLRLASSAPGTRNWHAMAFDRARQRVVLYGGQTNTGAYPTDVAEWDGTNWSLATPAVHPGQRWKHAMAYDEARQRIVLFGGSIPGVTGNPFGGDTWEYDGTNWTQRAPATSPSGRLESRMVYDPARQRVVLFGGTIAALTEAADTWLWDGTNWTAASPATVPGARARQAMAFDDSRQTVVMFGGYSNTQGYFRDSWEWNGADWIPSTPTVRPTARSSHAMAYDDARQTLVLYGGQTSGGVVGDTWLTYMPALATAYGTGCGSPQPLGLVPDASGRPKVGQTASATITQAPSPLVGVAIGWSSVSFGVLTLPLPLDSLGMPGCTLWQSTDILGLGATPIDATTFSFQLALPNQTNLLGHHAYVQAYALAPGQNALQVTASNGIDWRFGNV